MDVERVLVARRHPSLIDLKSFLEARAAREASRVGPRVRCERCRNPDALCYCARLRPFRCEPRFAILIHKRESIRTIATGRMAHLSFPNSVLFQGFNFSEHEGVLRILQDPANHCCVLYPGPGAVALQSLSSEQRTRLWPEGKQVWIFVIDATWSQAKRIWRFSRVLHGLPRLCFTPPVLSRFTIRQQPRDWCFSTLEAMHEVLRLLGKNPPAEVLEPLDWIVSQQGVLRRERPPRT